MIDHFNIIQALCRSALASPNSALIHQITRLRDSLEKEGHPKEAKVLTSLLTSSEKTIEMSPSKIHRSYLATTKGEELNTKTLIPVDKETSIPLAEIFFESDLPDEMPLLDMSTRSAVLSVMDEWRMFDRLHDIKALPASSCLIYGTPGTGKTHLAKWMAKQIGLPIVLARLEGLMSSFLGTTSRNISNLFNFANKYRCILMLDEFDAIAKLRNDPQEVGEIKRVVNTLLQCLDSRKEIGFTIAVTNHEGLLDPAIWRRFDIQLEIQKPSSEVLLSLIQRYVKPLEFEEVEIQFLAWCLSGASGADVQVLTNWLKRAHVLTEAKTLIEKMRTFAVLNTGRIDAATRKLIFQDNDSLTLSIWDNNIFDFRQKDLAYLFNTTQSAISKLLSNHSKNKQ
jgi:hypothetical protein